MPRSFRILHCLFLAILVSPCTRGEAEPVPTRPAAAAQVPCAPQTPEVGGATAAADAASPTKAADLTLPSDFPKAITVMEGSTLDAVQKIRGRAQSVLFSTEVEPSKVLEFYKRDLEKNGHQVTQKAESPERSFLSFKQGDVVTNVVVAKDPRDPKKCVIAVMYYEEQPAQEF
jgi:hypothetical protein